MRLCWAPVPLLLLLVAQAGGMEGDDDDGDAEEELEDLPPTVLLAMMARNKAHVLPYTLTLLERLDYPKDRISLYLRSDHNADDTAGVLGDWLAAAGGAYHSVNFSFSEDWDKLDPADAVASGPAAWTRARFRHVMALKEAALEEARRSWADYVWFVDADVLLADPAVLRDLVQEGAGVAAPLLRSAGLYSNFWGGMSESGYYLRTESYLPILERKETGCFDVPMVHTCVLVDLNRAASRGLTFLPERIPGYGGPYDDIIAFARSAELAGLPMRVCNGGNYGYVPVPLVEGQGLEDEARNLVDVKLEFTADVGPLPPVPEPLAARLPAPPSRDTLGADKVYLINLRRRPDRLAKMEASFKELGVEYQLMEAADGKRLSPEQLQQRGVRMLDGFSEPYHGRPLTYGEVGCFLSHYGIWRDVLDSGHGHVVVFEDDIRFEPRFREKLEAVRADLARAAPDWDLVFLGRKILADADEPAVTGSTSLVRPGYTYWTLAYLLSRRGAEKLVAGEPLGRMVPVDEYLPIMYDRHPNATWKGHFRPRDLVALSAAPLLVSPTHYTGDEGYVSDTEDAATIAGNREEYGTAGEGRDEL